MLKNITKISCKIGERNFDLFCDNDSPLNEVKESLFEFLKIIGKIEDAAKSAQKEQEVNDERKEQVEAEGVEASKE